MVGGDIANWQIADYRIDIRGQSISPLLAVFAVPPAFFILVNVSLSDSLKANHLRFYSLRSGFLFGSRLLALLKWVDPGPHFQTINGSNITRLSQTKL